GAGRRGHGLRPAGRAAGRGLRRAGPAAAWLRLVLLRAGAGRRRVVGRLDRHAAVARDLVADRVEHLLALARPAECGVAVKDVGDDRGDPLAADDTGGLVGNGTDLERVLADLLGEVVREGELEESVGLPGPGLHVTGYRLTVEHHLRADRSGHRGRARVDGRLSLGARGGCGQRGESRGDG